MSKEVKGQLKRLARDFDNLIGLSDEMNVIVGTGVTTILKPTDAEILYLKCTTDEFIAVLGWRGASDFTSTFADDTITLTGTNAASRADGPFQLTTTGTLPAGLALTTDYWLIEDKGIDGNPVTDIFKLALTRADALNGVVVTITDDGSGTHTITGTAISVQASTLQDGLANFEIKEGDGIIAIRSADLTVLGSDAASRLNYWYL